MLQRQCYVGCGIGGCGILGTCRRGFVETGWNWQGWYEWFAGGSRRFEVACFRFEVGDGIWWRHRWCCEGTRGWLQEEIDVGSAVEDVVCSWFRCCLLLIG